MTAHLFLLRQPSTKPSKTQLVCQSRSSLLRFCEGLEFIAIERYESFKIRDVSRESRENIAFLECYHVPVNYCEFLQLHCEPLHTESMRVTAPEDSRHGSDRRFTKPGYWSREVRHMTAGCTLRLYTNMEVYSEREDFRSSPLEPDNSSFLLCRLSTKPPWLNLASERVSLSLRTR